MLNKAYTILAATFFATAALAQTTSSTTTASNNNQTGATAYAITSGNNGYKDSSVDTVPAVGTIINSPTATCQQTAGAAASFMGGGFAITGDHTDKNCQDLEQLRTEYNMQQQATAILGMCVFENIRFTRAVEGDPCPAAFNQPGDPQVIVQASSYATLPPKSAPKITAPIPDPVVSKPAYCYGTQPTDSADQADIEYNCK